MSNKKITDDDFEKFDELHYRVEYELISLIKSLQQKWSLRHPASAGQTKEGRMARFLHRCMKDSNIPSFQYSSKEVPSPHFSRASIQPRRRPRQGPCKRAGIRFFIHPFQKYMRGSQRSKDGIIYHSCLPIGKV